MRTLTYREAVREAIAEEMERDTDVIMLGEDIGVYGGPFQVSKGLYERFGPERIIDTPISELGIMGAGVGLALTGMRPIVEIMYNDFLTLASEQLVNQAAKVKYMFGGKAIVPLVVRSQVGSGRGNAAQHSQSLEAWWTHIPGLLVVMPSTPADAKGLLKSAIREPNVVVFLEHKLLYNSKGEVPDGEYTIPLGQADIKRAGDDVTIVATSRMVEFALAAAEQLAAEGIDAEVIDPRTLAPLDEATILASVAKTNRCMIVHEAVKRGGVGAEISAMIMEKGFDDLDRPVLRLGGEAVPIPYNAELERAAVPSVDRIVAGARSLVN